MGLDYISYIDSEESGDYIVDFDINCNFQSDLKLFVNQDIIFPICGTRAIFPMEVGSRNISISKGFTYRLYGRDLNYIVTAVYERESIYRKIWEHKSLNIGRSIGSIRDNFEDDFKSAIDRLERELFELYRDMETIREHIFKYVENYVHSSSSLTLSEKLRRRIRYPLSKRS